MIMDHVIRQGLKYVFSVKSTFSNISRRNVLFIFEPHFSVKVFYIVPNI